VGAVLNGRYRLVRLLGEGGMGAVYEAEGVRGEGRCAVKMLHPEFVQEPSIVQRFFAEAQATRALQHPNVARAYDAAIAEDGTPYLVMELLQGMPLATWLENGRAVPPQQAAPIVHGVLTALTVAHAQRIVHRDLKPDNLFLVRDAQGGFLVKVLDFGIAKVMDAAGGMGAKTRTGVLLGTPGYMSPEQIKNAKGVDPRSDLWSVGVILYEMMTGQQPFRADNEFARLTAVLTDEVQPIERVAPHLAAWAPFFRRALAKDPAQRFQTADEMARALVDTARGTAQPAPQEWRTVALSIPPSPDQPPAQPTAPTHVPATRPSASDLAAASAVSPGRTAPSAPLVQLPTHASAYRPVGTPTLAAAQPSVEVVDAPPLQRGVAHWVVGVIAFVCLGLGFAAGLLVGGG
jgi:serine/threonine-protein kinase